MFPQNRVKYNLFIKILFIYLLSNQAKTVNARPPKAYLIEDTKFLTWHAAVEYCKSLNMSLLRIESYEEFEYLKTILRAKYEIISPYWLNAYKTNGVFKWISTGKAVNLFIWHAGEPDNKSGNERCIHTWEDTFEWSDNDCERELPFICQLKGR